MPNKLSESPNLKANIPHQAMRMIEEILDLCLDPAFQNLDQIWRILEFKKYRRSKFLCKPKRRPYAGETALTGAKVDARNGRSDPYSREPICELWVTTLINGKRYYFLLDLPRGLNWQELEKKLNRAIMNRWGKIIRETENNKINI